MPTSQLGIYIENCSQTMPIQKHTHDLLWKSRTNKLGFKAFLWWSRKNAYFTLLCKKEKKKLFYRNMALQGKDVNVFFYLFSWGGFGTQKIMMCSPPRYKLELKKLNKKIMYVYDKDKRKHTHFSRSNRTWTWIGIACKWFKQ